MEKKSDKDQRDNIFVVLLLITVVLVSLVILENTGII